MSNPILDAKNVWFLWMILSMCFACTFFEVPFDQMGY